MEHFEHYKEIYYREIDRTKTLYDGLNAPVGIITVLATAIAYYLANFDYSLNLLTIIFLTVVVSGSIFLCLSISHAITVYNFNYFYPNVPFQFLPDTDSQNQYFLRIKEFHENSNPAPADPELEAKREFDDYLMHAYINSSTANQLNNDKMQELIFKSQKRLLVGLVLVILGFIPFSINYATKPDKTDKIEIIKSVPLYLDSSIIKHLNMPIRGKEHTDGKSERGGTPKSDSTHVKPRSAHAYPAPPQGREVEGGKVVKGRRLEKDPNTGKLVVTE